MNKEWTPWEKLPKNVRATIEEAKGRKAMLTTADHFVDYFENKFGEEWVFYSDGKSAMLLGLDINWQAVRIEGVDKPRPAGLLLDKDEATWLLQVWVNYRAWLRQIKPI